ncbi:serine/threonine-protein kinase NLK isoform X1 [Tachysurus ichikawai]
MTAGSVRVAQMCYELAQMKSAWTPDDRCCVISHSGIYDLDLITDLLGTPSLEAMRTACEGARAHILRGPHKQVRLMADS